MSNTEFDYLVIPRLHVKGANAMSAYWCLSPEIVMASRQMAHALARVLGIVPFEAGVAIIHHDVDYHAEQIDNVARPHQRRGAVSINDSDYVKSSINLSSQPTASMDLIVSLVIRVTKEAPISMASVTHFLNHGRLAGGLITHHCMPVILDDHSALLRYLRTGYVVVERHDLLTNELNTNETCLDNLLRVITTPGTEQSWVVPALLGYQQLTTLQPRSGARGEYMTTHVEPLIGFIQYISIHSVKDDDGQIPFWDYGRPSDDIYLIQQPH